MAQTAPELAVSTGGTATAGNQTNGLQLTQIVDAGGAAVNVTGTSLDVNITGGGAASTTDTAFAYGAAALTNAYAAVALTVNAADANSAVVPTECWLGHLSISIDTVAGGASLSGFYLSEDAAGKYPITAAVDLTWIVSATATFYILVVDIDTPYKLSAAGVGNTIYAQTKLNAGTANGIFRLFWKV